MGRSSKLTVVDVVWPGQMHQRGRRDRGQEVSQDTPETRRALGAQLTKRRHQLGLSQTALAAAAGVATGTIVSAERGKPVQPIKLAAITAALGADIETSDDTPRLVWEESGSGSTYEVETVLDLVRAWLTAIPASDRGGAVRRLARYMADESASINSHRTT